MVLTLEQYQRRLAWANRLVLLCFGVAGLSGVLLIYFLEVGTTLNIFGLLLSEVFLFVMAAVFFLLFRGLYRRKIHSLRPA